MLRALRSPASALLLLPAVGCSNAQPPTPVVSDSAVASSSTVIAASATVAAKPAPPPAPPPPKKFDPCEHTPDGMACIPGGPFVRGRDDDDHKCFQGGQPYPQKSAGVPSAKIHVDTFYMDLTEVTVAAWQKCFEDNKACREAKAFYRDFDRPEQAKMGISWYDAKTYCEWAGKRLPTEAEWEKAARGPDGEVTPFGNEPVTCKNAVIMDDTGRSCGTKNKYEKPETGRVLAVKSRPPGRYGLYDMVGNAEEWVADWWTPSWEKCGEACAGPNPKGPCAGAKRCKGHQWRAVRGGSWYWPAEHATGYHRRRHYPANIPPAYHHFGFRCAKDAAKDPKAAKAPAAAPAGSAKP